MNSIYYSEIQKIIYDMGHRENFLYSTVDAIDTLILNYLYRYEEIKNGKVSNITIDQFAALNIQNFYKNYIMEHIRSGVSEEWGKTVVFVTFICLDTISKKDEAIKILSSQFNKLVLNM